MREIDHTRRVRREYRLISGLMLRASSLFMSGVKTNTRPSINQRLPGLFAETVGGGAKPLVYTAAEPSADDIVYVK